ncbi:FAD-dependent oxidoreductase [Aeromicrobium sp. YIM 150415]|uniref:FAD-dependent oxidoreductase n=1 Tax=Aeromicrobium sp. YIM 150415 TaxID=2803912 RepID=UPI001965FFA9|nr:FAD-dependent oxidoreductase [Aeromicrobium sp. YIM 150415]MBM9464071.1 FAD-dependent oxidoreductase [Aeromicrobium sp. YIM 150415]
MTYVITKNCCSDASCVAVCPVQCIRPRPGDADFLTVEQLYVDPVSCIDCGACADACPVDAALDATMLTPESSRYLEINADYFTENPIEDNLMVGDPVRRLPRDRPLLKVAIVGSGPAACYTAEALTDIRGVHISVFDKLPLPFGLARTGIAPDHADTRRIMERFHDVLMRPNVDCYFNVEVGRDITVEDLLGFHHAVVAATGAAGDRVLALAGDEPMITRPAREFVGWYNGHPDHSSAQFDLTGDRVVVIGNGNVALDLARTLVRDPRQLESTDMASHAVEALHDSRVREVMVTGRRDSSEAAFSTGELMELEQLDGVDLVVDPAELAGSEEPRWRRETLARAATREIDDARRRVVLRFGLTPLSVDEDDGVLNVTFGKADGATEVVRASLILRAVGYRGVPLDGVPFDDERGTVIHDHGRVLRSGSSEQMSGVYCVGWIKRGAIGGIGANRFDANETVESLIADFASGDLADPACHDLEELSALITARQPRVVDKAGWRRIEDAEAGRGDLEGRTRVRFVTIETMLAASGEPPG